MLKGFISFLNHCCLLLFFFFLFFSVFRSKCLLFVLGQIICSAPHEGPSELGLL